MQKACVRLFPSLRKCTLSNEKAGDKLLINKSRSFRCTPDFMVFVPSDVEIDVWSIKI